MDKIDPTLIIIHPFWFFSHQNLFIPHLCILFSSYYIPFIPKNS